MQDTPELEMCCTTPLPYQVIEVACALCAQVSHVLVELFTQSAREHVQIGGTHLPLHHAVEVTMVLIKCFCRNRD